MKPGDPIPAAWLQKVAGAVLQRISVRGARVRRVGTSLAIDIDQQRQGSRIPEVYKATADESGGTVTVKQLKVDGTAIGDNITLNVLPSLAVSEDDYTLKARTADGELVALRQADPPLYKATADPSGGNITVKRCKSDGTTTGDTITLKVVP